MCRYNNIHIIYKMRKKTITLRVDMETKEQLDGIRGEASYNKFIKYLVEFFLTKK